MLHRFSKSQLFATLLAIIFLPILLVSCDGESSSNITQENVRDDDSSASTDNDDVSDVQCDEDSTVIINNVDVCPDEEGS